MIAMNDELYDDMTLSIAFLWDIHCGAWQDEARCGNHGQQEAPQVGAHPYTPVGAHGCGLQGPPPT